MSSFQYWADVAREKGFVDTDEDIRFSPTLSSPMEDVEYTSSDDDSSMEDLSPACPRVVTPVDFPFENNNDSPLSRVEDKGLVADHVFFAFAQMTGVTLTSDDKAGPWKDRMCGEKGLTCRHCQGRVLIKGKPSGRWFPTSATNLGQTTTMNSIVKHAKNCPHAPTEVKNAMASLLMCNDSTEVQQKKKYGSRKTFFSRVFHRMMAHEEPQPPLQSHVHLFSPIIVQSDEDDDDSIFGPAGSKRNRAPSACDGATRKRRG